MKKTLFAMAAFLAAAMGVNAQTEVTPRAPQIPWGATAEVVITSDLTEQHADGSWYLTSDAQKWVTYESDQAPMVQQTNRANVWYDIYSDVDTMIVTSAEKNWGGYLTVTSKAGSTSGLMVVGKTRFPHFFVTGTEQIKLFFSGSSGTKGQPQMVILDKETRDTVVNIVSEKQLTKSTWDTSEMLKAKLDKSKSYEVIAKTAGNQGDIVLQAIRLYGGEAQLGTNEILTGSEIGGYINAYLAAHPGENVFKLQGNGKYTIKESIAATGSFQLLGADGAPATIDASQLDGPFVKMSEKPCVEVNDKDLYVMTDPVQFKNVKIYGLNAQLFYANRVKYMFPAIQLDNTLVEIEGGDKAVFDFFGGGATGKLAINKSTIYAKEKHTGYLFTSQGGQIAIQGDLKEQVFSITNSTIANIAYGKNIFNHRQRSQTWQVYEAKNSLFLNTGKKGQLLKGFNGGIYHRFPLWKFEGNSFLWTEADGSIVDCGEAESTGDPDEPIKNTIKGVTSFAGNTNFTVNESSMQAKYKVGDPRWLVPYATAPVKLEVENAGTDIIAAINKAIEKSELPKNITVTIYTAGTYTTSGALKTNAPVTFQIQDIEPGEAVLKVNHGFTLGGAIKFDGVDIDASDLDAPLFTLAGNDYILKDDGFYNFGKIQLLNMKVKGLKNQLIYGNKVKNLISEIETKNSVILMAGNKTVYDFNGGGVVGNWNFVNSTLDANGGVIYSSQSGQKATEAGLLQQTFNIQNSTIYKPGKKAFNHRQSGQTWLRFILKNSLINANADKPNFVSEMNAGQQSKNPVWQIDHNAFQMVNADGELVEISASQNNGDEAEPITNTVEDFTTFADAAAGDFTISGLSLVAKEKLGDPRWVVDYNPVVDYDFTAKVGTSQAAWNAGGVCATQYAPAIVTADGRNAQMMEKYEGNVNTTGELMFQEVTGLPNGKYTVTLFANAFYTNGRGFDSDVTDGATDVAYVFANDKKAEVVAHIATATAENGEYTIKDVEITDGKLKLGFGKEKAGTNWHTIQIKSLTCTMTLEQAFAYTAELGKEEMSTAVRDELEAAVAAEPSSKNFYALQKLVNTKVNPSINSYKILNAGTIADNSLDNWTCTTGNTFHINTWSVEGNEGNDPTGMTTPFIENWCNKNDGGLGDGEIVFSLPYVDPIDFEVTALVRLYSEAGNEVKGATFFAGNSEVDMIAAGNAFEYNNMKGVYGTYTATGTVGEDGVLRFGVNVKDANFNWVAIKNITITSLADQPVEDPGTLVFEKDWSTETAYPYYNMGAPEGASYEVKDGKLVVTNTQERGNLWDLQLFALDWFNLKQGGTYTVRFWANVPADGDIQVNIGTWGGNTQTAIPVKSTRGKVKPIDVTFENLQNGTSGWDAHVLWQQGKLVGTVEISKVQVFEIDPEELVINGYCEGADGTSLVTKNGEDGGAYCFNPKDGAGLGGSFKTKAAAVHVPAGAAQDWDSQFFIYEPSHVFQAGEKFRISFNVRADKAAAVDMQAHSTPGNYIGWYVDGAPSLNVTTEWQEVVIEGTITDHDEWGAKMTGMQTLAFNLSKDKEQENNFYFDNISWKFVPVPAPAGTATYAIQVDETHASGDVVKVSNDGNEVATITFGEAGDGNAEFGAGKASGDVEGFVAMTAGNGVNGNKAGGTFYTIVPQYDGVIAAAVSLNSGKKFHLTVDGEQNSVFNDNTVDEKYNGIIEFNVQAGKAYKFYCDGSKLGFYGFNYAYGPDVKPITEKSVAEQMAAKAGARGTTAIQSIEVAEDGVMYNMRGQRISAPVKGEIYIMNGKKHIAK
ncbi:MAG: DUF4957 domain-containing protein [Prevotella sp.]|nr:DUF4957 domain-containing protein [Prevotella sp.]